jgi:hypothetical protein
MIFRSHDIPIAKKWNEMEYYDIIKIELERNAVKIRIKNPRVSSS